MIENPHVGCAALKAGMQSAFPSENSEVNKGGQLESKRGLQETIKDTRYIQLLSLPRMDFNESNRSGNLNKIKRDISLKSHDLLQPNFELSC